jgi:hypothetical protein
MDGAFRVANQVRHTAPTEGKRRQKKHLDRVDQIQIGKDNPSVISDSKNFDDTDKPSLLPSASFPLPAERNEVETEEKL